MDLQTFKSYNAARADLDELVAMAAFGRVLRAGTRLTRSTSRTLLEQS